MAGLEIDTAKKRLSEQAVKNALGALDWNGLRKHLDDIAFTLDHLKDLCGHIRRCTDLICKHPRKEFEDRRANFFHDLKLYVDTQLGATTSDAVGREIALIAVIEHGYRSILDSLGKCEIGKRKPTVRAAGIISRAYFEYQELLKQCETVIAEKEQMFPVSGVQLQRDDGTSVSADALLDGLSASVAMTLIMEGYINKWFDGDTVVLPEFVVVDDDVRFQSGSTQVLAMAWSQWQRVEKRRRFLGGDLRHLRGDELPDGFPTEANALMQYLPPEESLNELEVYDYIANNRLHDRLVQNFMEMVVEAGLTDIGVGIGDSVPLPPLKFVCGDEAHAGVALSEILGYSIVNDDETPGGLRILEWVRGYAVLKEIARSHVARGDEKSSAHELLIEENELIATLQACGLPKTKAHQFVENTCLHRASRDMFDCPLIRVGSSQYHLFAPSVLDLNIALVVLSNIANRGEQLGRKGKAFERSIHETFRNSDLDVFAFSFKRNAQEFEYDAVVPWDGYIFIFECKNRSLSGNDPVRAYYFDLDTKAQAKQVRRLADALADNPDIIEREMGSQHTGSKIIPCVLHSLPYSRLGDIDGVYFTDASALIRFLAGPNIEIKVPHRVGSATLLHSRAVKRIWEGETCSARDLLTQLDKPFQLDIAFRHVDLNQWQFQLSNTEIVLTYELVRNEMTAQSVCEVLGADADDILREIASVSDSAARVRET